MLREELKGNIQDNFVSTLLTKPMAKLRGIVIPNFADKLALGNSGAVATLWGRWS